MRVAAAGSSGFLGSALVERLTADGHQVLRLVRRPPRGPDESAWDPQGGTIDVDAIAGCDAVVNMSGAGIGDHRWTSSYRKTLHDSRVPGTRLLAETLAGLDHGPRVLVSTSAIGYYGPRGDEDLDEDSAPGEDFLARLVQDWEQATAPAREAGLRVAIMRNGLVLGRGRGLLARLVPPVRFGVGARLGSGRQWLSWISLTDQVEAMVAAITDDRWSGPVNVTSPQPVTNAELTAELGRVLRRPTFLAVPAVALRAAFGAEMADLTVLCSQRVLPRALVEGGFTHADPELGPALARILAGD